VVVAAASSVTAATAATVPAAEPTAPETPMASVAITEAAVMPAGSVMTAGAGLVKPGLAEAGLDGVAVGVITVGTALLPLPITRGTDTHPAAQAPARAAA
jgi:hypothetical protein